MPESLTRAGTAQSGPAAKDLFDQHPLHGTAVQITNGGQSTQSPDLAGDWLGRKFTTANNPLHLRLTMESGGNAPWKCTLYSLLTGTWVQTTPRPLNSRSKRAHDNVKQK